MKPRGVPAKPSAGLRLLAYARVSDVRGRQGPGFISEDDQLERCRAYAKAYGHRIVREGSDLDVSGGVMSRPTFDGFLETLKAGKADGLIVAKLDRFARSNAGALDAVTTIEQAGGVLISVSEQIDSSTAAGRFLRSILFSAAEWERERIRDNWITARTAAVGRGIHVTRHVPPGYVRGPKTDDPATDRRLVLDPAAAPAVAEAFAMAGRGESYAAIADHLTRSGVGTGRWLSHRIRRLLANRVYLGEARSGKGIVHPDAHPALVDEATFLLAQREDRARNTTPSASGALLAGLVRCAGCSHAMKPQAAGKTSPAVYRCTKHTTHGTCPAPATIAMHRLEDYVISAFVAEYPLRGTGRDATADTGKFDAEAGQAERAYRAALTNLALRNQIGGDDHDRLISALHADWTAKLQAAADATQPAAATVVPMNVDLAELVQGLRDHGRTEELRSLLAGGIEAVFVRVAANRARNLPVAERVNILFNGDELPPLPRRGVPFEPRPFVW